MLCDTGVKQFESVLNFTHPSVSENCYIKNKHYLESPLSCVHKSFFPFRKIPWFQIVYPPFFFLCLITGLSKPVISFFYYIVPLCKRTYWSLFFFFLFSWKWATNTKYLFIAVLKMFPLKSIVKFLLVQWSQGANCYLCMSFRLKDYVVLFSEVFICYSKVFKD